MDNGGESLKELIEEKFRCSKCRGGACEVHEVAVMTKKIGGMTKDFPHRRYLFASCLSCGSVEVYDPLVLGGSGRAGSVLDIVFGEL